MLSALPAVPAQVVGGNVYAITQGTGHYSINDSLAQNLTVEPWAEAVSAEIFSLGTLGGAAVVVRGVDPTAFLALEGVSWTPPAVFPDRWALAGSGLAQRSNLRVGAQLTLVGSAVPRLDLVPLVGTFHAATSADDELLVDYGTARFLAGFAAGAYHSIRVKTQDPAALVAFLAQREASVHVTGPGGAVGDVGSGPLPTDPRVINLFLRYGVGPLPADYVSEGVAEATNSVQLVALGVEALIVLLVAFGIHAVQARAFADRRARVGILRAMGAPAGWVRLRALRELAPLAALAAVLGSALGFLAILVVSPSAAVLAFGHEVRVAFDLRAFALQCLLLFAVCLASELVLLQGALRERPAASIRGEPAREPPRSLEVVLRD